MCPHHHPQLFISSKPSGVLPLPHFFHQIAGFTVCTEPITDSIESRFDAPDPVLLTSSVLNFLTASKIFEILYSQA